jgi:hemoglobin
MKQHRLSITVTLIFIFMLTALTSTIPSFAETMEVKQEKSLYERLGGYDAISGIVDSFLTKVWDDPVVGRFFVGMGTDTRNQLRQKNKNLMCANTGGPCNKINRPLEIAHAGLNITDKEFDIVAGYIDGALKEFKVPKREHDELMSKIQSLRNYVVEARIHK